MTQRARWMWLCLLAAVVVETLWLWDVLSGTHTPFARDVLAFTTPYGAEAGRLWRAGVWPWWCGRLGGGMPVFHHPSAEVATLFAPLYALLPPLHAFGVQLWACVLLSRSEEKRTAKNGFLKRDGQLRQCLNLKFGSSFFF